MDRNEAGSTTTRDIPSRSQSKPAHDRRMAAVNHEGVEIKVELRSIPDNIRRSARGTAFLPITGRLIEGTDKGARKDIELWDRVAQDFLEASKYARPTGESPLIVTFRGRARMKQSYNANNDSRTQKWPFNAKEFDIDFAKSPAAMRPVSARQEFLVLKVEERTIQSTRQKVPAVLARLPDRPSPKYSFLLPPALDLAFRHASPENPITAVFDGTWRMYPHNGSHVPVFNAKSCVSIEGRLPQEAGEKTAERHPVSSGRMPSVQDQPTL